ncbi:MAG: transglutaminase family protein [Alphaproteobacteria bacterium]|nr:transglutaminase family protein [Alphaproteobacteria bacterium]
MQDIDPRTRCANYFVDSDHPDVRAFAQAHAGGLPPREAAVALYDVIRDLLRYSPWGVYSEPVAWKASSVLTRDRALGAHCIDKANLLVASARALGIPGRLHFADVRNHIGTARLEALLGTNRLVYHGYAELYLEGRWVAATPAFNAALCEHLGVSPLTFDGVHDSVFQEYDREAGRFMEYVADHGVHHSLPWRDMFVAWRKHYPRFREMGTWPKP